jgi:ParB family chromosome partitioning protein
MRRLGARSIAALVLPEREIALQILALNTEKAHNLRERALEVIRIYRSLLDEQAGEAESSFAFFLEDPSLVTLGLAYEKQPRFGGGVYHPALRRVETFSDEPVRSAIRAHEKRAALLLQVEEKVAAAVARLKDRGLKSPYLRAFVVARINPLRWIKGEPPAPEKLLETMRDRAARFNTDKVQQTDIASAAGPPDEEA